MSTNCPNFVPRSNHNHGYQYPRRFQQHAYGVQDNSPHDNSQFAGDPYAANQSGHPEQGKFSHHKRKNSYGESAANQGQTQQQRNRQNSIVANQTQRSSNPQVPYNPAYQSWQEKGPNDVLIFLDLTKFKTEPCPFLQAENAADAEGGHQHNPKRCFFYHDYKKDRRRPLGAYTSEMCPDITNS